MLGNKQWFFSLLLFLLPISGWAQLVFGPGAEGTTSNLDAIVAVVNDDVITRRELETAVAQIQKQMVQKKAAVPPRALLEQQVLERLILGQLQLRAAERNGINVDDATLNATIENLARRNNVSLSVLRQNIEKDGISFDQFRDEVRRELMSARLRQKVVDSQLHISEQDVASLQAQTQAAGANQPFSAPAPADGSGPRQYHIAQLLVAVEEGASAQQSAAAKRQAEQIVSRLRKGEDFQQIAAQSAAGEYTLEGGDLGWRTAEQLPSVFSNVVPKLRPGQFSEPLRSPSGFHIAMLLEVRGGVDPAAKPTQQTKQSPPATASATDPNTVQQTRARHILLKATPELTDTQARDKLEELRKRIEAGEDFAALARTHSEDPGSRPRGGDLGWSSPGMLVPEFQQAMEALQIGQISAPFKTQFGWHIVQVLEQRQGAPSAETERGRAREALFRRRSDEEWEQWLRRARNEAYVEIRLTAADAEPSATKPSAPDRASRSHPKP